MGDEANLTGADVQATPEQVADPGRVTPELAASLPYDELKRRMRAEARERDTTATAETTAPDEGGEETPEGTVTPEEAGAARDPQTGRFAASPQTQGQPTTEEDERLPANLDDAIRVLRSVRGNLNTTVKERAALHTRVQELEAEAARQKQEAAEAQARAQHQRFEELVARLPAEEQPAARQEYARRVAFQAQREYGETLQQRDAELSRREFQQAKTELPAIYEDIAEYVATSNGIPPTELVALVRSPRVKNLIAAAETPEAVHSVSLVLGEMLSHEAEKLAAQQASAKEQRRAAKSATQVRDVPQGATPGGAQEDVVARINKMSRDDFEAYKKRLLRAAR